MSPVHSVRRPSSGLRPNHFKCQSPKSLARSSQSQAKESICEDIDRNSANSTEPLDSRAAGLSNNVGFEVFECVLNSFSFFLEIWCAVMSRWLPWEKGRRLWW